MFKYFTFRMKHQLSGTKVTSKSVFEMFNFYFIVYKCLSKNNVSPTPATTLFLIIDERQR